VVNVGIDSRNMTFTKKYPNAVTELLELFESAYALSQEVYDVIISH